MLKKGCLLIAILCASFSALAVNVNSASAEELSASLKGIGQAKAGAIIEYRNEHGPFKTMQELTNVKGVGAATIDINRENIELDVTTQ